MLAEPSINQTKATAGAMIRDIRFFRIRKLNCINTLNLAVLFAFRGDLVHKKTDRWQREHSKRPRKG